jgi:DNA-directed RNA polymerase specialized sigma24 family protein
MSDFGRMLGREIPRLRRYALALTRDSVRADDLVQSTLVRALAKSHLWQPGTNLRRWLFTMLHNQRVSEARSAATCNRACQSGAAGTAQPNSVGHPPAGRSGLGLVATLMSPRRNTEVRLTLCWREVDSNPRSPCGGWCLGLLRRSYGKFGRAN